MARDYSRILILVIFFNIWCKTVISASFVNEKYRPDYERRSARLRKEFTSMTLNERRRFINAYKIVSNTSPFRRRYKHLVGLHQSLFRKVHVEKQFFPWHRWYLLEFENLLRKVDPRITLPYWDWSLSSQKLWQSGKKDVWNNHPWGLGGNGTGRFGCVEKGPFSKHSWRLTEKSGGGCLRRNFIGRMPSIISIHNTLRYTPAHFKKFEHLIRSFYHNELHCCIQGTMELPSASNTPEFLLHHTFMDKLWYDWQQKGPKYQFKLDDNMESKLRGSRYKVGQLMDSFNLVNGVAVYYKDPFPGYQRLHATLSNLNPHTLKMLDSYDQNSPGACCPKTAKSIREKSRQLEQLKQEIPIEKEMDYGRYDGLDANENDESSDLNDIDE